MAWRCCLWYPRYWSIVWGVWVMVVKIWDGRVDRPRIYVSNWTRMLWKKLMINPGSVSVTLECLVLAGVGCVFACWIDSDQPRAENKYGESDGLHWVLLQELSCAYSMVYPGGYVFVMRGLMSNRRRGVYGLIGCIFLCGGGGTPKVLCVGCGCA